jgi:hypothetical protein
MEQQPQRWNWESAYKKWFLVRFILLLLVLGLSVKVAFIVLKNPRVNGSQNITVTIPNSLGQGDYHLVDLRQATYAHSAGLILTVPQDFFGTVEGKQLRFVFPSINYFTTPLASEPKIIIEQTAPTCAADLMFTEKETLQAGNIPVKVFTSVDAAMGRRMESRQYQLPHNGTCFKITASVMITNPFHAITISNEKLVKEAQARNTKEVELFFKLTDEIVKSARFQNV